MALSPGTRLDSYEIIAPLGAGGMGEVYRARDTALKRDVAIKVLPDFWSRDPERLDSLLTFFQFDPTYWTVLRTTNPIERLNKEFKRRTRATEVTVGEISTYRCLAYVAQTMEYRWSFHPLSQWSTVYTLNAACPFSR